MAVESASSTEAVTYRLYGWAETTAGSGGIGDAAGNDIVVNGIVSAVSLYDYELLARVQGNTELEMTRINNYDLRAEAFMANGANVSVSGFYKTFENHIELIQRQGGEFTWQNADDSFVYGIEIEGKANLTRQLDVRGNVTLIRSQTTITIPEPATRSMFGQAPYIINGMLSYSADSVGFSASVSYNVQGPKLAVVASSGVEIPDVFEMPRHLVDLTVGQRLGDHWSLSFRVRDLLNSPILRQYKFDAGYMVDFDRYTFGTTYNLTIRYQL
jgi:outer membrane receptor for ferrienterochelin and colicin